MKSFYEKMQMFKQKKMGMKMGRISKKHGKCKCKK